MIKRYILISILIPFYMLGSLDQAKKLRHEKKFEQAYAVFKELLQWDPHNPDVHFEYGFMLADQDNPSLYEDAYIHLKYAMQASDYNTKQYFAFAIFCCRVGKFEDAINAYRTILEHNPNNNQVLYNSAFTLKTAGHLEQAIAIYKKIIVSDPKHDGAHLGMAFAYLMSGDYYHGWKSHEYNLIKQGKNADIFRSLLTHNTLKEKRILLLAEGGIGDTINFIRYAQRLKSMGAYIIAMVQPSLIKLLSNCFYIDELVSQKNAIPNYDASVTLMSLPAIFQDTDTTIPQNIPYIFTNKERVEYWSTQLAHDTNFKIGICWQPDVHNDISRLPIARRGIPLSHFYKLGSTPGISLYSLQKIEGLDQLKKLPAHVTIHTFDESFDATHGSFTDTAAVMHHLDLVISADTATAHIAGALGRPVWLLLPFATDWRWIHNRTDSAWYPTMHIFKQSAPFDWQSAIEQVHTMFFQNIYRNVS